MSVRVLPRPGRSLPSERHYKHIRRNIKPRRWVSVKCQIPRLLSITTPAKQHRVIIIIIMLYSETHPRHCGLFWGILKTELAAKAKARLGWAAGGSLSTPSACPPPPHKGRPDGSPDAQTWRPRTEQGGSGTLWPCRACSRRSQGSPPEAKTWAGRKRQLYLSGVRPHVGGEMPASRPARLPARTVFLGLRLVNCEPLR